MKKLAAVLLAGFTVFASVSHAYKDGDKMPCGKIYYSPPGLRDSTKGNFALVKASQNSANGDSSFGPGVRRNN